MIAAPVLAMVEMPGLWAGVVALALVGAGALVAVPGLVAALALARRPVGRRRALGAVLLGAVLAGTGAGLVGLVDRGPTDPAVMDFLSFPIAGAALVVGLVAAWWVGRRRAPAVPVAAAGEAPAPAPAPPPAGAGDPPATG